MVRYGQGCQMLPAKTKCEKLLRIMSADSMEVIHSHISIFLNSPTLVVVAVVYFGSSTENESE